MGDHDHRPSLGHLLESQLHLRLAFRIHKGAGFIQYHHIRILQHGAGNGDALLFASREVGPLCTQDRVDPLRQTLKNIRALGLFQSFQHLTLGRARLGDPQIIGDGAFQQAAVLKDIGHMPHQLFLGDPAYIHAAEQHLALLRVKEAGDQPGDRGFSAAGRADDADDFISFRFQRQIGHGRRSVGRIAVGHVFQLHGRAARLFIVFCLRQGLEAEDRIHSGHCILDFHIVLAHEHDLAHGRGDGGGEDDIEQEVQQDVHPIVAPTDQKQRHAENKDKGAVDQHGVPQHGLAHHPGIVHAEFTVIIDGGFDAVAGKYGLPEGLDHRDAPHVLNSLVAHAFQGVLVEPHILLHAWPRHAHHGGKAQNDRDQAGDAVAPVVHKQHHQHAQRHGNRACHVRQVETASPACTAAWRSRLPCPAGCGPAAFP